MDAALPLIAAAATLGDALEKAGIVVAALLAGGAVLSPSVRARAFFALGALALTPVLLVADIWDSPQLHSLRDRPALATAAIVVALLVVVGVALLIARRPALLPLLAVAALPFRIPISAGGETANLLVPLYLVIAAGVLAHAVPRARGPDDDAPRPAGAMEWLLCGFVVLYAVQATYSDDVTKALQNVVFFYVPFALLLALLRELRWTERLALQCLGVLVALAVLFVCVGFWEYARKELLFNPKVIASNQYESYFRVNSLFFDPSIYGRFLAMVMLALGTVVLWARRGRELAGAGVLLALLWAGLILSFSQSSIAALLAGLAVLAALRWSLKGTAAVVAAAAVVGVGFVAAAPGVIHLDLGSAKSTNRATSGRVKLVKGGARLFADRPVAGWGSGSFALQYRRHEHVSSHRASSASHTTPLTIGAEQGVIGLAVYVALLIAAFLRLLGGARASPVRAYVAAAFTALIVHTMLYADFLEDPMTWTLLGVGAAFAAQARRADAVTGASPAVARL
jgi:O-antigen ligase